MSRLYWSNLPVANKAARRNKRLMEFIDDRGLADAGVAGNKNKLRPAAGYNTVEGGEQGVRFPILARTISRESAAGLACPVRRAEIRQCDAALPIHPDSAEDRVAAPAAVW